MVYTIAGQRRNEYRPGSFGVTIENIDAGPVVRMNDSVIQKLRENNVPCDDLDTFLAYVRDEKNTPYIAESLNWTESDVQSAIDTLECVVEENFGSL